MLNIYSVLAACTDIVQSFSSTSQAKHNVCESSPEHGASSPGWQQHCVSGAKISAWQMKKHFQLFSQIQRPRPAPHFSMRASSCSCRDVIWEKGARHYRKARLGLPVAPAQALLCFCRSSTYTSGCFAHTWQNSALPTGEAAQQESRRGNLLPCYLVETPKSCPGKKSAKTLQLLSVSYMVLAGFCVVFYPRQQS